MHIDMNAKKPLAIIIALSFKLEFLGIFRAFLCVCKQKRLNHWVQNF